MVNTKVKVYTHLAYDIYDYVSNIYLAECIILAWCFICISMLLMIII